MRSLKAAFQSCDNVITPLSTGFSENVLAMLAVGVVTILLYLIALPLFCWEGLNWIRSWEPVYIPGSAMGNVRLHLVSDDWYTAQQLPASSAATALSKETIFWEKSVKPPVLNSLSAHFAVPPANFTIGQIHEERGDVHPGTNSTEKFCDVTIPVTATLGDTSAVEKSVKERGNALEALIGQNLKSSITWMSKLKTLDVTFDVSLTFDKPPAPGSPKTKQLQTGTPPPEPAQVPAAVPPAAPTYQ